MDIRDWPIDRIMQLPDWCFGRRWLVLSCYSIIQATTAQWLVDDPLPERTVLWGFGIQGQYSPSSTSWLKLALGDHEPANDAEFDAFDRLFHGQLDNATEEGAIWLGWHSSVWWPMRKPLETAGKRFACQSANTHATVSTRLNLGFLISSVPKEVPDWLISA